MYDQFISQVNISKDDQNSGKQKGVTHVKESYMWQKSHNLYYVKANSYTKFQVNISKNVWEKFRKPSGLTDRLTDKGRADRKAAEQTD